LLLAIDIYFPYYLLLCSNLEWLTKLNFQAKGIENGPKSATLLHFSSNDYPQL